MERLCEKAERRPGWPPFPDRSIVTCEVLGVNQYVPAWATALTTPPWFSFRGAGRVGRGGLGFKWAD